MMSCVPVVKQGNGGMSHQGQRMRRLFRNKSILKGNAEKLRNISEEA